MQTSLDMFKELMKSFQLRYKGDNWKRRFVKSVSKSGLDTESFAILCVRSDMTLHETLKLCILFAQDRGSWRLITSAVRAISHEFVGDGRAFSSEDLRLAITDLEQDIPDSWRGCMLEVLDESP